MEADGIDIKYKAVGRNGKMMLTASSPDGTSLFSDNIDVTSATGRKRFVNGLCDGRDGIDREAVARKLEEIAGQIVEAAGGSGDDDREDAVERAAYADDELIVELAWNNDDAAADFVVFDRSTNETSRAGLVATAAGKIVVPAICTGIVTPGSPVDGSVYVPTGCDFRRLDEDQIRADVRQCVERYVELPPVAVPLAVEYVLLTWVHDAFDELPYLAFRTADCGRGKSRALETVGAICYRPMIVGGGSSAAATLRMLDVFGGTLVADEFDAAHNTELAADLNRILNQGFQRARPLIKCDGESNTPRPFRCYGPKLFALRSRLGDDATESRTLSVRMGQRTRNDIPLNLPRRRFDADAVALRNRLLAWRFTNLARIRVDPELADTALEDRANQIGLPLLSVASPETRTAIVAALRDQQDNISADRGDSLPGQVFAAILAVCQPGDVVRPGVVAAEVNRQRAEQAGIGVDKLGRDHVSAHKVGRMMGDTLELPRGPRDNRGAVYRLDLARMQALAKQFGVSLPETSRTAQRHSAHESALANRDLDSASGAGDVSDDSDVSPGLGDDAGADDDSEPDPAGDVHAESPLVPDGWSPRKWARELRRMANVCAAIDPQQATEYRQQADQIPGAA